MSYKFRTKLEDLVNSTLNRNINKRLDDSPSPLSIDPMTHKSLTILVQRIEAVAICVVKEAVARAAARVNLLGPVHRLPDDVLINVFSMLDNKELIHAARVGARWRTVALSAPTLWSNIDFTVDTGLKAHLRIMLARAQRVPLDLKLRMWGFGPPIDHEDSDAEDEAAAEAEAHMDLLEHLLQKQSHRLRSLDVQYEHSTFAYTAELFLPGAPLLTDLELNWANSMLPLDLTTPCSHVLNPFPMLKRLKLCGVLNSLEVLPRFRNVTSLTLRFPHSFETNSLVINLGTIVNICKSLEDLALVGVGDVDHTTIVCSSGIRLPARFQVLLDGPRAHEITNTLCFKYSSTATLHCLYVRDRSGKPTTAPALRIFDHLQPLLHDTVPSKLYIKHLPSVSSQDMHYVCAVEGGRRARGIRATGMDLKLLAPLVGAYASLAIDFTVLTSPVFPTSFINLKTLHVRVTEKTLPVNVDRKVHAPALRNFELHFARSRDDPVRPIIVRDVSNFLARRFADLSLPLDSVKVFGAVCSNGNQLAATRRLASEFIHASALDPNHPIFPQAMFPPEHFYY